MNVKKLVLLLFLVVTTFSSFSQLLYRISGNGLERPSYLFGTHHFAPLSILDSIPSVMAVADSVEGVVGELDMLAASPMELAATMQPFMQAPQDSTISKLLSPDEYQSAKEKFNALTGLQLNLFDTMRPVVVQTTITALLASRNSGEINTDTQLDTYIQKTASDNDKAISGLETIEDQARVLFLSTPVDVQAKMLVQLLDEGDECIAMMKRLTDAYMSRDLETLSAIAHEQSMDDQDSAFMDALLKKRNTDWLGKMPEIMRTRPTLFAVGALHLPDKEGLLAGLKAMGYEITPIYK